LSRRVSATRPVGAFAGILTAVLLAGAAFVGVGVFATIGYFAADLPAAHDLATVEIPLATHIYDRG
jgi:membrane carboxypeptidase/penicillin-binding protein